MATLYSEYYEPAPAGADPCARGAFLRVKGDRRVYRVTGASSVGLNTILTLTHASLVSSTVTERLVSVHAVEEILVAREQAPEEPRASIEGVVVGEVLVRDLPATVAQRPQLTGQ